MSYLTNNTRYYVQDWKRSIRHAGKSMKLLLTKGILSTHPPICDCEGCRMSSPVVSLPPVPISLSVSVSAPKISSFAAVNPPWRHGIMTLGSCDNLTNSLTGDPQVKVKVRNI